MAYLATERDYMAPLNEFPTGKGFADIVYLPMSANAKDKPAIIMVLPQKCCYLKIGSENCH